MAAVYSNVETTCDGACLECRYVSLTDESFTFIPGDIIIGGRLLSHGSFTLPETDLGTDSDFDSKRNDYIVLCRTFSHCTDSNSDSYSLFLYRSGIGVCLWQCK